MLDIAFKKYIIIDCTLFSFFFHSHSGVPEISTILTRIEIHQDLILCSGFFILSGTTMLSDAVVRIFSRSQLEEELDERNASPTDRWFCQPLLQHNEATSVSCSALNILAISLYYFFGISHLMPGWGLLSSAGLLAGPLMLLALLCNILSRVKTEEILVSLSRPLWFVCRPLHPISRQIIHIEEWINSLLPHDEAEESEEREEIIAAVTDGEHEGIVAEGEREMIVNIFDLKHFDISDIMTPRTDLCTVSMDATLEDALAIAHKNGYSRIPVYKDTRDNIRGIFFVKDTLKLWNSTTKKNPSLQEIMRPPFFVPETKNVAELMRELQKMKTHMAIVLDEYGGTAGLVTIEDVIEEIVGEIQDEYDMEEESHFQKISQGIFEIDARTHVHDINEVLESKIIPETENYETLAGFILDQLGHVPRVGESLHYENVKFSILAADGRRIEKVRVEQIEESRKEIGTPAPNLPEV